MDLMLLSVLLLASVLPTYAVRLHKIFQFLDGYKSDYYLQGWLHVGTNYAILLRKPKNHDRHLTYELYEARNLDNLDKQGPRLLAISRVPVEYIKQQLQTYRTELHNAKYVDPNEVPGTQVRTLREWQISKALVGDSGNILKTKPKILRTQAK